jgi:hypothetical protein
MRAGLFILPAHQWQNTHELIDYIILEMSQERNRGQEIDPRSALSCLRASNKRRSESVSW